jgi:hypothetical protein
MDLESRYLTSLGFIRMPLSPINENHARQIQAGILGRRNGHDFEDEICRKINALPMPFSIDHIENRHLATGDPSKILMSYVTRQACETKVISAHALSTGALATSDDGREWLRINGAEVKRCKSDIVLSLGFGSKKSVTIGVSTKQCNNRQPTNAQLYFTTAAGFVSLLTKNGISIDTSTLNAMRMFCGDVGFRPKDDPNILAGRLVDPRRYFWEELPCTGRTNWERVFSTYQNDITRLLLQKAYLDDQFVPDYLVHKTRRADAWEKTEIAIYAVEELVSLSANYQGFITKPYSVRKGSFRDPVGIKHLAPRFGIVQMQRAGSAQHPEQLQFNLEAGYFYRI